MDAVDASIEELTHDPGIGASVGFVEADNTRGDENTGRGMAAACRPAIPDAAHEFPQLREIHSSMFEIDRDGVGVSASHADALRIGIDSRTKPGAGVVNRLILFPQLDYFVEPSRPVIVVNAGRLRTPLKTGAGPPRPCRGTATRHGWLSAATSSSFLPQHRSCGQTANRFQEIAFSYIHACSPSSRVFGL